MSKNGLFIALKPRMFSLQTDKSDRQLHLYYTNDKYVYVMMQSACHNTLSLCTGRGSSSLIYL